LTGIGDNRMIGEGEEKKHAVVDRKMAVDDATDTKFAKLDINVDSAMKGKGARNEDAKLAPEPQFGCCDIRKVEYERSLKPRKETPPLDATDLELCSIYICHSREDDITTVGNGREYETWLRVSRDNRTRVFPWDFARKDRFVNPKFRTPPLVLMEADISQGLWDKVIQHLFKTQVQAAAESRKFKKILSLNPWRKMSDSLGSTIRFSWNGSLKKRALRNLTLCGGSCVAAFPVWGVLYMLMFVMEFLVAVFTLPVVVFAKIYDVCTETPEREESCKKWEIRARKQYVEFSSHGRHRKLEVGLKAFVAEIQKDIKKGKALEKGVYVRYKAGTKARIVKEYAVRPKIRNAPRC